MPACPADLSIDLPPVRGLNGGACLPPLCELSVPVRQSRLLPRPDSSSAALPSIISRLMFPTLWLFIGTVSAFDAYLTVKFQKSLEFQELNPLARMLLQLEDWDPSLFIGTKFLGSMFVLGVLTVLHLTDRRLGLVVAAAIASFQLGLLAFLVLA